MSAQLSGLTIKGRPISVSELSALVGTTCVLCHADGVATVGVFFPCPDHAAILVAHTIEALGPVQDVAQRVLVYGLCKACLRLGAPIVAEMVEAKLFSAGGMQ
jgi:hypothetical protein